MADIKDIISNIEQIYGSNNSLNLLKDFERVIDELDTYVYDNWLDGQLVAGPKEHRYFVECTFMWPKDRMPEPRGGMRLLDYGCKGKIDIEDIWLVKILMPKKLMQDINRGYKNLDKNKVEDIINQFGVVNTNVDASETQVQDQANAEQPAA
jgi:hypothetical protein